MNLCFKFILYILESLQHKLLYKLSYMDQLSLPNYLKISNVLMVFILGFSQSRFKCYFLPLPIFGHFNIIALQESPSS